MKYALPLVLALAACQPAPTGPTPSASATPAEPTAVSLTGHWRIAGIDGKEFNEGYGMAITADAKRIWWEPACAAQDRLYTIAGTRFDASEIERPQSYAVCTIGLPERLPDVWRAIDAADTIRRTPSNGIEISGGGHALLLFSQ